MFLFWQLWVITLTEDYWSTWGVRYIYI